jgi:glycerol kinase
MTMSVCIAAIDQGTTSTRCMVFDRDGRVAGSAQQEHRQIYPRPGWVEHDPLEILRTTDRVVADAVAAAGPDARIAAVGVTNQRETVVVWNRRTGEPYGNAIVWQDTRTRELCAALGGPDGPGRFADRTGLPLATYFSGPKIRWCLDHVDGLRAAAQRGEAVCGTIDSWLIRHLTGGRHVTDVTNASRTMLMNLRTLDWDDELLGAMEVPRAMLPEIVSSAQPGGWGDTRSDGPFGAAIPVCGVAGDQQAALLGQCCFGTGDAKNTYGTGCFLLLNTGEEPVRSRHGLITTVAWRFGDEAPVYALEGSIAVAGALVQWLRDNLGLIATAPEIEALAGSVEDAAGVYIVPAFSGLFAPHWRADARGVIAGLTRYATKAHLARAALEAVCYQTREVIEAMRADSGVELRVLKADGGMAANDLFMQMQADLLGTEVVRPRLAETTALGAAYAAGLAAGVYGGTDDLAARWEAERTWAPRIGPEEREERFRGWLKAVQRSLDWVE